MRGRPGWQDSAKRWGVMQIPTWRHEIKVCGGTQAELVMLLRAGWEHVRHFVSKHARRCQMRGCGRYEKARMIFRAPDYEEREEQRRAESRARRSKHVQRKPEHTPDKPAGYPDREE